MADIFESHLESDPWLEKLFMDTAEGGIETSLSMYESSLRNGSTPEQAYEAAISRPEILSETTTD